MNKNIGILGSGAVAKALAAGFLKYGYNVMLGTRDAHKLIEWKTKNDAVQIGSFEEAAKFGVDMIVLAIKGHAAEEALKMAGIENLTKKTIIDTTNPIDDSKAPINGVLNYFTDANESLMERLQKLAPEAEFVKAFNTIGSAFMVDPPFGEKPTMFICGNSAEAKLEVAEVLLQFGFEVEDMGKAEAARPIEALCALWCIPGFLHNQWSHAFRLIRLEKNPTQQN